MHSASASDTVLVLISTSTYNDSKNITLNHCGGQGRKWGQWGIKVVFFKNECLTCKLVME